jgi:hypothetical protein
MKTFPKTTIEIRDPIRMDSQKAGKPGRMKI